MELRTGRLLLREDTNIRGRWRDSLVYGVLEGEWGPSASPGC